jgi:histidinol-phosphatase (PHP family)
LIRDLGGRFVLSDDSHGPKAVGLNYDRVFRFLREDIDLKELYFLKRTGGIVKSKAVRNVEVARVADQWWEDPFWESVQDKLHR